MYSVDKTFPEKPPDTIHKFTNSKKMPLTKPLIILKILKLFVKLYSSNVIIYNERIYVVFFKTRKIK